MDSDLLTARKKEWWPATADSLPQAVYLTTVSGNRTHDIPIVSPTRYQLCHRDQYLLLPIEAKFSVDVAGC